MNVNTRRPELRSNAPLVSPVLQLVVRHVHRERDFGVGYGNSSGYANPPRAYAGHGGAQTLFRCR